MCSLAGARVGDDHRDGGILAGPAVMAEGGRRYLVDAHYSYADHLVVQDDAREIADARCRWDEETMGDPWNEIGGILVGSSRIYYHHHHVVGLGSLQNFDDIGVHRRRCCCFRAVGDDWLHRRMVALAVRHRHHGKT